MVHINDLPRSHRELVAKPGAPALMLSHAWIPIKVTFSQAELFLCEKTT